MGWGEWHWRQRVTWRGWSCCSHGCSAVGISGAGLIADDAAGSVAAVRIGGEGTGVDDVADGIVEDAAVVIVTLCTILGIETVPAWVVHKVAIVAGTEVAGITQVAAVTANVDGVAGAIVACWLVFAVVVGVVVVVAGDLHLS